MPGSRRCERSWDAAVGGRNASADLPTPRRADVADGLDDDVAGVRPSDTADQNVAIARAAIAARNFHYARACSRAASTNVRPARPDGPFAGYRRRTPERKRARSGRPRAGRSRWHSRRNHGSRSPTPATAPASPGRGVEPARRDAARADHRVLAEARGVIARCRPADGRPTVPSDRAPQGLRRPWRAGFDTGRKRWRLGARHHVRLRCSRHRGP